jgi:hypothetical protein
MPAVTVATVTLTSRRRALAATSVVNRNAPSSTRSVATKTLSRRVWTSAIVSWARSPSFIELPSASLISKRAFAPVTTLSFACSSVPAASGARTLRRSIQAGICTASMTAWA